MSAKLSHFYFYSEGGFSVKKKELPFAVGDYVYHVGPTGYFTETLFKVFQIKSSMIILLYPNNKFQQHVKMHLAHLTIYSDYDEAKFVAEQEGIMSLPGRSPFLQEIKSHGIMVATKERLRILEDTQAHLMGSLIIMFIQDRLI